MPATMVERSASPAQHTILTELNRVLHSIAGVVLIDDTDAQRFHLVLKDDVGDVPAMIHAPDNGRVWIDALLEIGFSCLDNRTGDPLKFGDQLPSALLTHWLLRVRRPPVEIDPGLCHDLLLRTARRCPRGS